MTRSTTRESRKQRHQRILEENKCAIVGLQARLRDPNITEKQKQEATEMLSKLKNHVTRKIEVLRNGAAAPPEEDK